MIQFLLTQIGKLKSAVSALNSKITIYSASKYIASSGSTIMNISAPTIVYTDRGGVYVMSTRGSFDVKAIGSITITPDSSVNTKFTIATTQNSTIVAISRGDVTFT